MDVLERKILRRIVGPSLDENRRRMRYNDKICGLYIDMKVTECIKFRRLQWRGHVIRMEEYFIPKKALQ
jgi:hypothetical protein